MDIEARLAELGITLPPPPVPVASYVPFTVCGPLITISGQIPLEGGEVKYIGKLGDTMSLEDGQAAARLCALNIVAQLKAACGGDLGRVVRCVRLGVFVNAAPDFTRHPEIANGASDLIAAIFGEAGRHARAATGASSLPRGVAVEVDAMFEIR